MPDCHYFRRLKGGDDAATLAYRRESHTGRIYAAVPLPARRRAAGRRFDDASHEFSRFVHAHHRPHEALKRRGRLIRGWRRILRARHCHYFYLRRQPRACTLILPRLPASYSPKRDYSTREAQATMPPASDAFALMIFSRRGRESGRHEMNSFIYWRPRHYRHDDDDGYRRVIIPAYLLLPSPPPQP